MKVGFFSKRVPKQTRTCGQCVDKAMSFHMGITSLAPPCRAHLTGVKRLVQELKPRMAERLHRMPRRHRHVGLGVYDVAVLLYHLQAVTLKYK